MDESKKSVIASFLTTNGDYLVLVKWIDKGWRFDTQLDDWVKADEYVIGYTWHPEKIGNGGGWGNGIYYQDIKEAFDDYLNKFRQERNKY